MRALLILLATTSPAAAIGFCEDTESRSSVLALSEARGQIAVERVEETCEERDGDEDRSTLRFVEVRDLKGEVIARYGDANTLEAHPKAHPIATLQAALKAGGFKAPTAWKATSRCVVKAAVVEGELQAAVHQTGKATPLLTRSLVEDVRDAAPKVAAYWMGAALVLDVEADIEIDQGMLGTASGHASEVVVFTDAMLAPCAQPEAGAPITVVGVLGEDGIEACQDGQQRWVNVHATVGWSAVYGLAMPAGLKGTLVQVTGAVITAPKQEPVKNDFTCPPMQARSDWIRTKDGVRYKRKVRAPRRTLKAEKIEPFTGLTARLDAATDTVTVTLRNPLPQALVDVTLVLHYEGCYGKPMHMELTRPLGRIEPGKQVVVEGLPARQVREHARGNEHALSHIQVVTPGSPILDIDVAPAVVGALVSCTDR